MIDWKTILIKNKVTPIKRMVLNIDLDQTLSNEVCWNKEQVLKSTPLKEMVEFCWSAHNDMEYLPQITIYTARKTKLARETVEWLEQNNLPFPISFRKKSCDVYIGDECINTRDCVKYIKGKKLKH